MLPEFALETFADDNAFALSHFMERRFAVSACHRQISHSLGVSSRKRLDQNGFPPVCRMDQAIEIDNRNSSECFETRRQLFFERDVARSGGPCAGADD